MTGQGSPWEGPDDAIRRRQLIFIISGASKRRGYPKAIRQRQTVCRRYRKIQLKLYIML